MQGGPHHPTTTKGIFAADHVSISAIGRIRDQHYAIVRDVEPSNRLLPIAPSRLTRALSQEVEGLSGASCRMSVSGISLPGRKLQILV